MTKGMMNTILQIACDRCTQGVMDQGNPHLHGKCQCQCHSAKPISFELAKLVCEIREQTGLVTEMFAEDQRLAERYHDFKYPDPFQYEDAQAFLEASRKASTIAKEYLGTDRYGRFLKAKEELSHKINEAQKLFSKEFDIEYPKLER